MSPSTIKILMICMGNICRSPLAEGVFREIVEAEGLGQHIEIDSAGTHFYHVGNPPDPRSIDIAGQHGLDISTQRCRQLSAADFTHFDYLLVMDKRNQRDAASVAPSPELAEKLQLFLNFAREPLEYMEVPDPYHEGPEGFELVYQLVASASRGLLEHLKENELAALETAQANHHAG